MLNDPEDFRTTWRTQPTTFFQLAPREMQASLERIDSRQRRIARGIVAACIGDLIAFTMILFLVPTNTFQVAGCVWIMLAMVWFARRLWAALLGAERTRDEMLARPSIDAFRASLEARRAFYRSMLTFGGVLPGVLLFLIGALVAEADSVLWVAATGTLIAAAVANGFRIHLPPARAIRQQLAELDRL